MVPRVSTMLADTSVFVLRGTLDNTVIKVHVYISGRAFTESFPLTIKKQKPNFTCVDIKCLVKGLTLKFHPQTEKLETL